MPISIFAKRQLVPYVTGNEFPPNRSGRQLITLFNEFGSRDVYQEGLPLHPRTRQNMSRTQYVEHRLDEMDDANLCGLMTKVLNEYEGAESILERVNEVLQPEGFNVVYRGGTHTIIGGIVNRMAPIVNEAHFQEIQNRILHVLDNAQVSIKVVIAWFTNELLRDKLLEKQAQGVEVSIAIYDDGINARHGVDLEGLNVVRLRRGQRGGLMHDKFCVVDNQIVITGSYNWTNNAEFRNDENISVARDPEQATRYSLEYRRLVTPQVN